MNIQTQRNLEAFAEFVDLRQWATGRWLRCRDGRTEIYLDVVERTGRPERVRMSVSVPADPRNVLADLADLCCKLNPRASAGIPVRFFRAGERLVGSACMPADTSARQWLPVYGYLSRRMSGCLRSEE